jgi:hypothetical protein
MDTVRGRRVENLGANVSEWCLLTGEGSTTYDVCMGGIRELEDDPHCHDDLLAPQGMNTAHGDEPQGVDGWGGDVIHPPYDEMDPRDRICAICACPLKDEEGAS